MDAKEFHKGILVYIAWNTAPNNFNASVGVMLCLRNRVRNDDWATVLRSAMLTLYIDPYEAADMDNRNPEFMKLLVAADQVYEGQRTDITNGCTLYTKWPTDPLAIGRPYETKIGNLYFYK